MTDLVTIASQIAMQAAAEYQRVHKLSLDADTMAKALRSHLCIAMPKAIADAREAIEAHMEQMANATFAASIRLAGIAAAKEVEAGQWAGA